MSFGHLSVCSPPVVHEEGSTARTDTLCPLPVSIFPMTSMNEDFPAPGGPDSPEVTHTERCLRIEGIHANSNTVQFHSHSSHHLTDQL